EEGKGKGEPKKDGTKPVADADRKAAEYILLVGGAVRVNDEERDRTAAAELPREPFRLTGIHLSEKPQVNEAGLSIFKDCKNLTSLGLRGMPLTDASLVHFKNCKHPMTINMERTQVTDAGLVNFKDCKGLNHLHLHHNPQIRSAGFAYLKDCKKLSWLNLYETQVGDEGIAYLKDCKMLGTL